MLILPLATCIFNEQIQEYLDQIRGQMYTESDTTVVQMQGYLQSNLNTLTTGLALQWVNVLSNLHIILLSAGVLFSLSWTFVLLAAVFALIDLSLSKIMVRMQVHDSKILLIDEGISAIDKAKTRAILQELFKMPNTIIFHHP